jgi:hypothetical protein
VGKLGKAVTITQAVPMQSHRWNVFFLFAYLVRARRTICPGEGALMSTFEPIPVAPSRPLLHRGRRQSACSRFPNSSEDPREVRDL